MVPGARGGMSFQVSVPPSIRVEGYAVISEDGMLADANGIMPDVLKIEADQRFFERRLDGVDAVIHGRNSQERHTNSHKRDRIIVTTRVAEVSRTPSNRRAVLWNPKGAPLRKALALLHAPQRSIGVLGATNVFALFLDRYDFFYLSCAQGVRLAGGLPVFPQVPALSPADILQAHGLARGTVERAAANLTIETWRRNAPALLRSHASNRTSAAGGANLHP
jgi:hypothetical protein